VCCPRQTGAAAPGHQRVDRSGDETDRRREPPGKNLPTLKHLQQNGYLSGKKLKLIEAMENAVK